MTIIISIIAIVFSAYIIIDACRHFIGYNPTAPSGWTRFKAWVKSQIFDPHPENDESHARIRYRK